MSTLPFQSPFDHLNEPRWRPSHLARGRLEVIGEGSFGCVYGYVEYPWSTSAYKVCIYPDSVTNLLHECKIYDELRMFTIDNDPAAFICPMVQHLHKPPLNQDPEATIDPIPDPAMNFFPHPTLQVSRIPALPVALQQHYHRLFVSAEAQPRAPTIRLLRLYLGMDLPEKINEFPQGFPSDLPLDCYRYAFLQEIFQHLPVVKCIAQGMGRLLARMHWGVGIDARGVKLVLGNRIVGNQLLWQCWVLDFNKCRRWLVYRPLENLRLDKLTVGMYKGDDLVSGAKPLARIISGQEFYYPRPHQTQLYLAFKNAYMEEVQSLLQRPINPLDLLLTENRAGAKKWAPVITQAAHVFFKELEGDDDEKRLRFTERPRMGAIERIAQTGAPHLLRNVWKRLRWGPHRLD
ncbi:hypothetical protein CspHIS471_0500320 [Cutaneotrichosporon sp. HIS471]|nr:hypothetical protein CspHIS471_0500320 [Cutaneotrichosporon sp. HIS471]